MWPDAVVVTRGLLGVLLVVTVALATGFTSAALVAGGAAAIAGATALQDSPRGRTPLVVWVSFGMGAAVLAGAVTTSHPAVFVAVVTVWCFAAGMLWALGANAGLIAAASTALLVTSAHGSASVGQALAWAGLAVAGGLVQAALVAVWPGPRWHVQRLAVRNAYAALGGYARALAENPEASLDPSALVWLRDAFRLTEFQARRRPLRYRLYYGLPERIYLTLTAHAREGDGHLLRRAAEVLDAVADGGRGAESRARAALDGITPDSILAQHLRAELSEACDLHFTGAIPDERRLQRLPNPGPSAAVGAVGGAVRAELSRDSPVLRHAIRLAAAVGAGAALVRFADVPHGYWVALTVLMVLRPESVHTNARCLARIGGNVVGVAVAGGLILAVHPAGHVAAILAVVSLGIAYAASNYVVLSAALAAGIVFLIATTGVADAATFGERLLATAIGGALAVVSHLALPDRPTVRLQRRVDEFVRAQCDYAAAVVEAFVENRDAAADDVHALRHRAIRARSAADAAAQTASRAGAPEDAETLGTAREIGRAITVLEALSPPEPTVPPDPALVTAGYAFGAAMRAYAPDSLIDAAARLRGTAAAYPANTSLHTLVAQAGVMADAIAAA